MTARQHETQRKIAIIRALWDTGRYSQRYIGELVGLHKTTVHHHIKNRSRETCIVYGVPSRINSMDPYHEMREAA